MKQTLLLAVIVLLTTALVTTPAFAEEFVISGNGDGSANEVAVTANTQTTVTQTNEANVSNEVNTNASTGGNEVSSNTGEETSIQTGDIQTQTSIDNQLNTSAVDIGCCPQGELTATIEGNGSTSTNAIDLTLSNQTTISVLQEANIQNTVTGSANTGENTANDNNGNVAIQTGNITGTVEVKNSINQEDIHATIGGFTDIALLIKGNSSGSQNSISLSLANETTIEKVDLANILNMIFFDINTGRNQANGNLGDVSISTGDIVFGISIKNDPVNQGGVDVGCCPPPEPPYDPGTPPTPPTPPGTGGGGNGGGNGNSNNNGNGNGSGDGNGQSLAMVSGAILPATGNFDLLLMLLANIAMFLLGLYLRLRAGRSPARLASNLTKA